MAYTRPAYNAAESSWLGQAAYTRPAYNDADASFLQDGPEAIISDGGLPLPPSVLVNNSTQARIAVDSMLGVPAVLGMYSVAAWLNIASPLGAPAVFAMFSRAAWIDIYSPLGAPGIRAFSDFTPMLSTTAPITYTLDLVTTAGNVRVPISSWQATLQVSKRNNVSCVVPVCLPWLDYVADATEFFISRAGQLPDGTPIEQEMAHATTDILAQTDRGPNYHNLSLSGYTEDFEDDGPPFEPPTALGPNGGGGNITAAFLLYNFPRIDDPDTIYDRELTGIRSIKVDDSGEVVVRCAIDWLLRPAQRALYGGSSFIVSYINYYVQGTDWYMDVGERNE